ILVLLVAVERHEGTGVVAIQHGRDRLEAREIGLGAAADFELEVAVAIRPDRFIQRLGQAVANALLEVGGGDGIDETYGVPRLDRRGRSQLRKKLLDSESGEFSALCADTRQILPDRRIE